MRNQFLQVCRRPLRATLLLAAAVGTLLGLSACGEDNPADPGDELCGHFDADGVLLEHDGATLVSQWEGVVEGEVEIGVGATLAISVVFLDPDSARGTPGAACTDQLLDVEVEDEGVVTATLDAPEGKWSFHLQGVSAGETTVTVRILHVDHPDFTSLDLPVHVGEEGEVEIDGFRITNGATVLVEQFEGTVEGALELEVAGALGPLQVAFLGADGSVVEPEEGATLDLVLASSTVARVAQEGLGPYAFTLDAIGAGETTLTLSLLHEGHTDFASLPVPVRVVAGVALPEAALVREGRNPLTFWNYDPTRGAGTVQGGIAVAVGGVRAGLTLGWLGAYDAGAVNDKRPELELPEGFSMAWSVSDGSKAVVTSAQGPWNFGVTGLAPGRVTVEFTLRRNGTPVFTTGGFPIEVHADPAALTVQDHYLNLGGAWTVIVEDGALVANACNRDANPGWVALDPGELSALYRITLLDSACTKIQLDSDYEYRFQFADPEIARVVQTPIHWGEDQEFHIEGLSSGSTELTVFLYRDGVLQWKAPPYPVVVG